MDTVKSGPRKTQREALVEAFKRDDWRRFRRIVDLAQNGPPLGKGDESINNREWDAASSLIKSVEAVETERGHFELTWRLHGQDA